MKKWTTHVILTGILSSSLCTLGYATAEDSSDFSRTFAPMACTGPMKQRVDALKKRNAAEEVKSSIKVGDFRLIAYMKLIWSLV
jgi:hypothetical protein